MRPETPQRPATPEPVLFCWSGGKDSAMALHALLQQEQYRVAALLTTVTEGYDRIAMHGVRRELLAQQAKSIGLPLHEVCIPPQCANPVYEARMEAALLLHYEEGIRKVAFGDIFIADLRAYRENGEFHTFVFDGPIFHRPVSFRIGDVVERDSFAFCDLLPEEEVQK